MAALYFSIMPNGGLRILFTDVARNRWVVDSSANAIQDGKWHAVAATSDGNTLSLYLKNITDGAANYSLVGAVDISASQNPALSTGSGNGADWDPGVFSVARGLYNGGHTDRFFGHLDDIRLSEGALAPDSFLYSEPTLSPAASWRLLHFGTTENTGDAADNEDPDLDGINNLLERALAGNPRVAETDLLPVPDPSAPMLSILYRRSKLATDLSITVQESETLSADWIPSTGTESVLSEDDTAQQIRFTRPAGNDDNLYLRIKVEGE